MFSTKIVPEPLLSLLKKQLWLYSNLKKLVLFARSLLPPIHCSNLPGRIHPNDFMLKSYTKKGLDKYKEQSKRQFQLLTDTLNMFHKDWQSIHKFIDIGCGYGRIVRWVTQTMSKKSITVCDVIPQAVNFVVQEFGVKGIITDGNLSNAEFEVYDFIFSCSLLTHLSPQRIKNYLHLLQRITQKDSLILFSIHGEHSLNVINTINRHLDKTKIAETLKTTGIYFHPYPHYKDKELGDTFFSIEYLQEQLQQHCANIQLVKQIKGPCYQWGQDWVVLKNCH